MPATEPLTVDEVAAHLRMTEAGRLADLDYIVSLINAARVLAEKLTARALITQTWQLKLDDWQTNKIVLPRLDVQSITSIQYVDANGATQPLASNQYTNTGLGNRIVIPSYGVTWPSLRQHVDVVTITFVAGYGAASAVPQPIKRWMLLHISNLFENREALIIGAPGSKNTYSELMLDLYKVPFA